MNTLAAELRLFMKERSVSQATISRSTGISTAALSQWLNGSYTGNTDKIDNSIRRFISREKERFSKKHIDFVMTNIAGKIFEVARIAHIDCEIGLCYGQAGLGKTQAVKEYARLNTDVILIEADPGYTTKVLFSEIHKKLGLDGNGSIHSLAEDIIEKLKYSGRLIIIDEAEHLPYRALDLLRRIHDKASIGMLLVGMPVLLSNLRGKRGQYEQLYSRIGIAGKLTALKPEDTQTIVNSVVSDSDKIWETYHKTSGGNTRVLIKLLTRSIKVAEINRMAVNPEIVRETARMLIV